MQYVEMTNTPDPDAIPAFLDLLAFSPAVTESRLYEWNPSPGGNVTLLFEVIGDRSTVDATLADLPGVVWYDATAVSERRFNLLILLEPGEVPLLGTILGTMTQPKLVIAKPVVCRDGSVHSRIVGPSAVLQSVLGTLPHEVDVTIERIGVFDRSRGHPLDGLSDRQREALLVAFELGYYDVPRAATHADVAERLGCAPNTASEHLQKAERDVITEALDRDTWR